MDRDQLKQKIMNVLQLLLNTKDNEKEVFITNFLGVIATFLSSNEPEMKEFSKQVGTLLMSVYSNPNLDIHVITSKLTELNDFINKEAEQLKAKEDENVEDKNKEESSIPKLAIESESNQLEDIAKPIHHEIEYGIKYREHDWRAMCYGLKGEFSNFGSTGETNSIARTNISRNIHYSKRTGLYNLNFSMKQLCKDINRDTGPSTRGGVGRNYLSLSLTEEELDCFCGDENDVLKLSTGEDLMEAIERANYQHQGIDANMPKVLLPFSSPIIFSETDILFIKLLVNYYSANVEVFDSSKADIRQRLSTGFKNFNVLSGSNLISVNQMVYLSRLLKHCEKNFDICADTFMKNCKEEKCPIKPIIENQNNKSLYIYSGIAEEDVFTLDIEYGVSSQQNMSNFYHYLLNSSNVLFVTNGMQKCQEKIIKWENIYKKKYGDDYLEQLQSNSNYKFNVESYNSCQEFLNRYYAMRNETLRAVEQLYEYNFGAPIQENSSSIGRK